MSARKSPSRGVVIGVLAGISAVGGTVAYGAATASSPPVPYIIHACWNPKQGAWAPLHISRYNQACPAGWVNIGWTSSSKTGPRGPRGPAGAPGRSVVGSAGTRGAAGATGANGNTVLSGPGNPPEGTCVTGDFWIDTTSWSIWNCVDGGWTGPVSLVGPQGPTGNQGATGADGMQGATGPQGAAGVSGATGADGMAGATGAIGATGAAGAAGATGANGNTVLSGPGSPPDGTCVTGDFWIDTTSWSIWNCVDGGWTGPMSLVGPQGPTGDQGATGATGPQGAPGATGDVGPKGDAGIQGATGASGPQGATGPSGHSGSNGLQGSTGEPGGVGLQGATGPQGPTGASGPRGATGSGFSTANVTYYSHTGVSGDVDVEAYCPTGKIAIGGGYIVNGIVGAKTHIELDAAASLPVSNTLAYPAGFDSSMVGSTGAGVPVLGNGTGTANGWAVYLSPGDSTSPMTTYVVCGS